MKQISTITRDLMLILAAIMIATAIFFLIAKPKQRVDDFPNHSEIPANNLKP